MDKPYVKEQWLLEQMQVLEEIHLPLLFVKECLTKMSPEVLQTYLLLLTEEKLSMLLAKQRAFTNIASKQVEQRQSLELFSLAERLALPPLTLKQHFESLEQLGLVRILPQKEQEFSSEHLVHIELLDYRLQKLWQTRTQSASPKVAIPTEKQEPAEKMLAANEDYQNFYHSIQMRFLAHSRVGQWQQLVYRFYFEYQFEKDVIFQLFLEAEEKKALTVAYLNYMGEMYAQASIKTFKDLEEFKMQQSKSNQFVKRLQKFLNRKSPFTSLEVQHIEQWFKVWSFEEEAIFALLKHLAIRSQNMTIHFIESVLKKYYEKQALTLEKMEAILAQEQEEWRLQKEQAKPSFEQRTSIGKAHNVANFEQREVKDIYDDLDAFAVQEEQ